MRTLLLLGAVLVVLVGAAPSPAQPAKEVTATSPDGKRLARAKGETIEILDVATRRTLSSIRAHRVPVSSLNIAPDGKQLVSADGAGVVCMFDVPTGRLLWQYRGAVGVVIITFSNDGKKLSATLSDRTNLQLDSATGKRLP